MIARLFILFLQVALPEALTTKNGVPLADYSRVRVNRVESGENRVNRVEWIRKSPAVVGGARVNRVERLAFSGADCERFTENVLAGDLEGVEPWGEFDMNAGER